MSKNNPNNKFLSSNYDTTISLLNVYFSEWSHRDQFLWSKTFKLYYAILIIILLPNITNFLNIKLPPIPTITFRIIGLLFSFIFFYITFGYAIRFQAIADTYLSLINKLPIEYRRKNIEEYKMGKLFSLKLNYLLCFLLFLSLFILSIILMVI